MSQLASNQNTATQSGQLVWLVSEDAASQTLINAEALNTSESACLDFHTCKSMQAVCDAIVPHTAMLVIPAEALTPESQLLLRDKLMGILSRTDLPVVVVTKDADQSSAGSQAQAHALPDVQLLDSVCSLVMLPASALTIAMPGLVKLAFTSHRQHEFRHETSTPSGSLEKKAQHDQIFQTLLKVLPVGIVIAHDVTCSRMTMNPAAAQLLDVPLEVNPSKTGTDKQMLDFTCIENGKAIPDHDLPMQIAAKTGKSVLGKELQLIRGDGTKLDIVVYAVPLFDDHGHPCGCAGVLVDITIQKKIQLKLTKAQARLSLAQQCAKAGVWDWDFQTGEIIWSKEMYELHGLPTSFDPSFDNWHKIILPQDLPLVESTISQNQSFQMEYRTNRPDGALQWVLSTGQLANDKHGKPLRMSGICMDVTEHKITEQSLRENVVRFRTMMDASPLGVFITDDQGKYQYTNAVLQRISQMSDDQLVQDGLLSIVHSEENEHVLAAWKQAIKQKKRFEQICRLKLPNEEQAWIHLRAEPVIDNHKLSGYIGKVEDITRQRRAQAALRLSRERLQNANDTLAQRGEDMEELLSITAHDLKHPVVGIQGLLSLLKEDCYARLDEENKLNLDLSLGECERMKEMLTRLSELGRIEQTRPRMVMASFRDVVETCVKRFQAICQQYNITIRVDVPQKQVLMPKAILEEVLSNLIDNAIKYGCTGEHCVIDITATCENELCSLTVKDNGLGIAAQHHERIFRPFRRLVSDKTKTGSGLGLTAVKRLIQRIGGQVRVISAPNQGASFEMQFPVPDEAPCEESSN